jgi:hypothetical protein
MILYINGDSHSTGAEAVVPYSFANDSDRHYATPHRHGHAQNLPASFGVVAAKKLGWDWINQAESGSSNNRIIRTTEIFLETASINDLVILIGWTTWEREEWLHNDVYYQVNASGKDQVPPELRDKYKQWVVAQGEVERERKMLEWHKCIHQFHMSLRSRGIRHLFFNTYSNFALIERNHISNNHINPGQYDWHNNYIDPYNQNSTYYYWLENLGYQTVAEGNYHYGKEAHAKWAEYLVTYLTQLE